MYLVKSLKCLIFLLTVLIRRVPLHFEQRRSHLGQYPKNTASPRSQGNTCGLEQLSYLSKRFCLPATKTHIRLRTKLLSGCRRRRITLLRMLSQMRSLIFFQVDFIILLINLNTPFRTVTARRAVFSSNERIQRRKRRLLRLFNSKTTLLPVIS